MFAIYLLITTSKLTGCWNLQPNGRSVDNVKHTTQVFTLPVRDKIEGGGDIPNIYVLPPTSEVESRMRSPGGE